MDTVQVREDLVVNLAVDHADRGFLHDRALVALAREDVEIRLAHQVMPFAEVAGVLVEVVVAGRDLAIDAAGDSGSAAGAGDEEHGSVALDHGLGRAAIAQQRLFLLERGDELLPVLGLECGFGHDGLRNKDSLNLRPGCPSQLLQGYPLREPAPSRQGPCYRCLKFGSAPGHLFGGSPGSDPRRVEVNAVDSWIRSVFRTFDINR
jgi:hypothetical protein